MSVFTHTRYPEGTEASEAYRSSLELHRILNRHTGAAKEQWLLKLSRWSPTKRASQLREARRVQESIEFNDRAKKAWSEEGVVRGNRRRRDDARADIKAADKQNRRAERDIDRDSDREDKVWQKRQKQLKREVYGDQKKQRSQNRGARRDDERDEYYEDPPSASGSDESEAEDSYDEEPPRRQSARDKPRKTGARSQRQQEGIQDAIEMLRQFGIETVTPNGCKYDV